MHLKVELCVMCVCLVLPSVPAALQNNLPFRVKGVGPVRGQRKLSGTITLGHVHVLIGK